MKTKWRFAIAARDGAGCSLCCLFCCLALVWGTVAVAGDVEKLKLPADKELLKQIAEMPSNYWLKLPPVKTAGELAWLSPRGDYRRQGPRIRDYCNKMVWAPERQRALYCGAGHNIHLYNDVWEYDLASNTWICLYAPDPTAHRKRDADWYRKNVVLRDEVIRTPRGAPLRPAHTWWGLCYDNNRRRLVFWDAHKGLLFTNRSLIASALKIDVQSPLLRGSGSGPGEAWIFEFDPASKKWSDVLRNVPKAYESSQLEFLSKHRTFWLHPGTTYVRNAKRDTWESQGKGFNSNGAVTAYDPDTDTVILVSGSKTMEYDCAKRTWTVTVENGPDTIRIPQGTFCFDLVARKCVLFTNTRMKDGQRTGSRMWLYDLASKKWTDPKPPGGCPQLGGVASYYDAARNVTVIYSNNETWVYRAQKSGIN